ncbi:unnamed protein product [Gongylonema pulchrum]|uniref:RGS domain-containing protein n=1 Tax=Gongylonema pulchrum TaxID=637853 RepID=A0A183EVE0_9BILA|nr:unnamed protein product [Gongylonema pulchrum]
MDTLSPTSWDHLINKILYERDSYDKFIRNSNRQDNFICEGKCRFESLCFLRKGHHNETLCNHIASGSSFWQRIQKKARLLLPSRLGSGARQSLNGSAPRGANVYARRRWLLWKKKHEKFVKKLRRHFLKKFMQLFSLKDEDAQEF